MHNSYFFLSNSHNSKKPNLQFTFFSLQSKNENYTFAFKVKTILPMHQQFEIFNDTEKMNILHPDVICAFLVSAAKLLRSVSFFVN